MCCATFRISDIFTFPDFFLGTQTRSHKRVVFGKHVSTTSEIGVTSKNMRLREVCEKAFSNQAIGISEEKTKLRLCTRAHYDSERLRESCTFRFRQTSKKHLNFGAHVLALAGKLQAFNLSKYQTRRWLCRVITVGP